MKIAYLSQSRVPSRSANSVQVMKMCQAFVQCGHEVQLVCPRTPDDSAKELEEIWTHYGVSSRFPIRWFASRPRLREYDYYLSTVAWAKRVKFDLVYTRTIQIAAAAVAAGLPTILELHEPPSKMGVLRRFLFSRALKNKDLLGIVAISSALQKMILEGNPISPEKLLVCHDAIDVERFNQDAPAASLRSALGLETNRFTVVYCGHLYQGRGIDIVFGLAQAFPDFRFVVVGGHPEAVEDAKKQVMGSGLKNVIFTGFVNNYEVSRYLLAADVLLMPYQKSVAVGGGGNTVQWMSPLKMFEYMAAQRPIISSDLPVLREVLDETCARFCPPDDLDSWATALRWVYTNPDQAKEMASLARERVESRHTWKFRVTKILDPLRSSLVR